MATGERIEGLNVWRAGLMLAGMATHATILREDVPMLMLLANASHAFRMGVFFVISGLLTGFALLRRPHPERWLKDRLIQIGVPTVFGIGVVSPLIGLAMLQFPPTAGLAPPLLFDWYHLWFLVALLVYSVLGYALHRQDGFTRLLVRLAPQLTPGPRAQSRIIFLVGGVSLLGIVLGMALVDVTAPERYVGSLMQIRLILGYAPLFLLGFAIGRSDRLRETMVGTSAVPVAILIVFATAYAFWYLGVAPTALGVRHAWAGDLLTLFGSSFCPPAAAALVLRSAITIRSVPASLARLSDASFTMYIVHYPIAVEATALLTRVDWNDWIEFTIIMIANATLSYAFHRTVVRRSATMALLLNGRWRRPAAIRQSTDSLGPGAPA